MEKFANTLRLRMLVHLHNGIKTKSVAAGVDVAAQVAKITSDGFLGAGESAHLNPGFPGQNLLLISGFTIRVNQVRVANAII